MEEKEQILKSIVKLIKTESENLATDEQIYLHTGSSGVVLFLVLYSLLTEDESLEPTIEQLLENITGTISKKPDMSASYCEGLCGITWLLLYLKEIDYLDYDTDDFFDDCDQYMSRYLTLFITQEKWDPLHGAIGLGFYFLKRKKVDEVEKIIHFLKTASIKEGNEIKWARFEKYFPAYVYDTGFAHGNAGIVSFLSQCYQQDVLSSTCKELLSGSFEFYINHQQNHELTGSYWRDFIEASDKQSELSSPKYSRMAWCYGDLNILNTLHSAAKMINDQEKERQFFDMLLKTSSRKSFQESLIQDSGICHGSSGIALIYQNIYSRTAISVFNTTRKYWLDLTINSFIHGYRLADNKTPLIPNMMNKPKLELLDGVAGVGLVILSDHYAYKSNKKNLFSWKESLFLFD